MHPAERNALLFRGSTHFKANPLTENANKSYGARALRPQTRSRLGATGQMHQQCSKIGLGWGETTAGPQAEVYSSVKRKGVNQLTTIGALIRSTAAVEILIVDK